MNRIQQSAKIIEENQSHWGSYIASPNFSQYGHSWFRDGSFIAHSMTVAGRRESSTKFLRWGLEVLKNQREQMEKVVACEHVEMKELLPARYTLDGQVTNDDWPNAQNDGYGTFLWALSENGDHLDPEDLAICDLCIRYLEKIWKIPCFDVWEEFPDAIHTSTLLAISAGLRAGERLLSRKTAWKDVLDFIMNELTIDGRLRKSSADESVDSSLVWASFPFRLLPCGSTIVQNTVRRIIEDIYFKGGVKRYACDSYYGGGSWVLLSAYLGCHMHSIGESEIAEEIWTWISKQYDDKGYLPEQVPENLLREEMLEHWINKWGPIASPLLWSHAAFLEFATLRAGLKSR